MRGTLKNTPTSSKRPERDNSKRALWEHNKRIILATQSVCGICGKPVDKSIRYPDPMSPTVDHIIPIARNGDPVALDNLQLAHRYCNRMKSDKLPTQAQEGPGAEKNKSKTKDKYFFEQSANWRTD